MSTYEQAQARLADAKRRGDRRDQHTAIEESKRLLTQALDERFGKKLPWWRRILGRRRA